MSRAGWLLYGANGYTGELTAIEAARRGERPILAGRREAVIRPLAEKLGLDWRVFELADPAAIAKGLEGVAAVLLCAGPFSHTSKPMVDACLAEGVHYLDITGEIGVFERVHRRDAQAKEKGVVLLPGSGFDVVPSDCLAAALKERLPAAERLELAFSGDGGFSRGTAKTMIEGLPQGGAVRREGKIVRVALAWKTLDVPFRDRRRPTVSIPWGDVSTAYYSTGIPNIVTYMAASPRMIRGLKLARPFTRIIGLGPVQRMLTRRVDRGQAGPSEETRERVRSHFWGRVTDATGHSVEGTLETPEGYKLTVMTSLECVKRIVAGQGKDGPLPPGAHTPSTAFGAGFIKGFEGCDLRIG
jgi:short subunit dehydrogenase-like uncharacterized protein